MPVKFKLISLYLLIIGLIISIFYFVNQQIGLIYLFWSYVLEFVLLVIVSSWLFALYDQSFAKQQSQLILALEQVEKEKERSEDLADDLKKFKLAVENVSDHIIMTNPEGKIIYVNKAAEKLTGYTMSESLGKAPSLWGGQMPKSFYIKFWQTIKTKKKPFYGEIVNKRKNGQLYEAEVHVTPVLGKKGQIKFFVGVERDITVAKQLDRAKTEFVSLASHQLRTPLTYINWFSERLLKGKAGPLNKQQIDYVQEVHNGGKRMTQLVKALLNATRIDVGKLAIDPKETDIKAVLEQIIKEFKPLIKKKKIKLGQNIKKNIPNLIVDPELLTIIMQNLISNAIKYTPEKGRVNIALNLDKKKKYVIFQVKDTGYGIPDNQQDKIFAKLFRADNIVKKQTEGTGLGLYLVKAIIEKFKGRIWFESVLDKGSTFYVAIPLKPVKKVKGIRKLEKEKVA